MSEKLVVGPMSVLGCSVQRFAALMPEMILLSYHLIAEECLLQGARWDIQHGDLATAMMRLHLLSCLHPIFPPSREFAVVNAKLQLAITAKSHATQA